jgi:hypothetical protein
MHAFSADLNMGKGSKQMAGKLKVLGLALIATFVLSAAGASLAIAEEFHSSSGSGTTYLTMGQTENSKWDIATEFGA